MKLPLLPTLLLSCGLSLSAGAQTILFDNDFEIADTDDVSALHPAGNPVEPLTPSPARADNTQFSWLPGDALANQNIAIENGDLVFSRTTGTSRMGFKIVDIPAQVLATQFIVDYIDTSGQDRGLVSRRGHAITVGSTYGTSHSQPVYYVDPGDFNPPSGYLWAGLTFLYKSTGSPTGWTIRPAEQTISEELSPPDVLFDFNTPDINYYQGPQEVSAVFNSSASTYDYVGPDGQPESTASGTWDLWIGLDQILDDYPAMPLGAGRETQLDSMGLFYSTSHTNSSLRFEEMTVADVTGFALDFSNTGGEPTTGPGVFADFDLDPNGWVDTGAWMGPVYVEHYPWVYVFHTQSWFYAGESEGTNGAWFFAPRASEPQP